MEKKYFGGNMEKNVAFGLSWIPFIGWIFALILFIMDKDTLDLEEKRELVSVFVCTVVGIISSVIVIGPFLIAVLSLVNAIMTFIGKGFKVPGAYHLAAAIIK